MGSVIVSGGLAAGTPTAAGAVPVRGATPWSVLLCRFADQPHEPEDPAFFRELLTDAGAGRGGVADYLADQSAGTVTLAGSVVRDWVTMPRTRADARPPARWQTVEDCVNAHAAAGYAVPAGHRVIAVTNAASDAGADGVPGRVLLDPGAWTVAFATHEMLHAYGLWHSWSDDTAWRLVDGAGGGEYDDPWDQMSALNVHGFATARFGPGGVGLNGFHRDKLGWLPRDRVVTVGLDGAATHTLALASLERPGRAGPLLVRVPFDRADPAHYFTVELRTRAGWSAGIPADTVLIHEIEGNRPRLLRSRADRSPLQSLDAHGVRITVEGRVADTATVTVTTPIPGRPVAGPNTCVPGTTGRNGDPFDVVCVTGATAARVAADNASAPARWAGPPGGSPRRCLAGYVWREAWPGDDVCVEPAQRAQAAGDNASAPARSRYGYAG